MKRALAASLLLALAACTGPDARCAALSAGSYCLQPSTGVAPFEATQLVQLRFRERRETLLARLEVDAGGLRFVGLTPFGQKLVQLSYDNHALQADAAAGARFDPAVLAAALQLALWPAELVRAGLSPTLRLEEGAGTRRVVGDGAAVVSIRLDGDRPPYRALQMTFHGADLDLTAETLDEPAAEAPR